MGVSRKIHFIRGMTENKTNFVSPLNNAIICIILIRVVYYFLSLQYQSAVVKLIMLLVEMLDTSSNHKKETNYLLRQNMEAISTEFYWTINFDQGVSAFLLKYILPNDPSRCILKSTLS